MNSKGEKDTGYLKIIKMDGVTKSVSDLFITNALLVSKLYPYNISAYNMVEYMIDSILLDMDNYSYNLDYYINNNINANNKGLITEILKGMINLDILGIIHGNLKPTNIFFDSNGRIAISDYCLNSLRDKNTSLNIHSSYYSPELLNNKEYDKSTDIWSLGYLFYYILSKSLPTNNNNRINIVDNVKSINGIDKKYKEIILTTIQINKYKRPTIYELFNQLSKINDDDNLLSNKPYLIVDNNIKVNDKMIECMIQKITINELLSNYKQYRISKQILCLLINIFWFNEEISVYNHLLKYCNTTIECMLLLSVKEKYKVYIIHVSNQKPKQEYLKYTNYFLNYLNYVKELSAIRLRIDVHSLSYFTDAFQSMNYLQSIDFTRISYIVILINRK